MANLFKKQLSDHETCRQTLIRTFTSVFIQPIEEVRKGLEIASKEKYTAFKVMFT